MLSPVSGNSDFKNKRKREPIQQYTAKNNLQEDAVMKPLLKKPAEPIAKKAGIPISGLISPNKPATGCT
ncbi:MAG TPA: hypothetical protein DEV98_02310 [Clostridiales bacterium]|nr:hypothetical protein [Clostridiales bacterium]